ncbi:hypothetical protein E2320_014741 [Naja naja]|nr:hypothetical protein E2320_014741 [Naja naja]
MSSDLQPPFLPSAAEEIAISWPRITAFAESHRRRGLGPVMESEQSQALQAQLQSQAAGPSESGLNADLRRQLGFILQTAGRSQVEKMLRELVKEQSQEGKRKARKKGPKNHKDEAAGENEELQSEQDRVQKEAPPSRKSVSPDEACTSSNWCPQSLKDQQPPQNSMVHQQEGKNSNSQRHLEKSGPAIPLPTSAFSTSFSSPSPLPPLPAFPPSPSPLPLPGLELPWTLPFPSQGFPHPAYVAPAPDTAQASLIN